MNRVTRRRLLVTFIGLAILAAGYFGQQAIAGQKEAPPPRPRVQRVKSVTTRPVTNGAVAATLDIQGRLQAYNKVALFSEVGGLVRETGRPFKVGTYFPEGSVLLRIDNDEARLGLQAQKATLMNSIAQLMPDLKIDYPAAFPAWERYLTNLPLEGKLPELPEVTDQPARLFLTGRNIYTQYYTIKSVENRLEKYTLYAPFSGTLTATSIDKGAVVRAGQQLGELMATGYYELVATVPLSQLDYLEPGAEVDLFSDDLDKSWTGKVRRTSDQIDPSSQTVDVFIGVSGKGLREGMYLRGAAEAQPIANAAEIDRDLLVNEEEVYVVEADSVLRRVPVQVAKFNRETAIVRGIPDGAQLLTSSPAGAFDGMIVRREDAPVTK